MYVVSHSAVTAVLSVWRAGGGGGGGHMYNIQQCSLSRVHEVSKVYIVCQCLCSTAV